MQVYTKQQIILVVVYSRSNTLFHLYSQRSNHACWHSHLMGDKYEINFMWAILCTSRLEKQECYVHNIRSSAVSTVYFCQVQSSFFEGILNVPSPSYFISTARFREKDDSGHMKKIILTIIQVLTDSHLVLECMVTKSKETPNRSGKAMLV